MTTMRHGSLLERKKKQWEEERAFMNGAGCGFWGLATPSEPKKATPPTDKPPDPRQKQQLPPTPLQQPPPSTQQQKPIPQMQAYQSPQPHVQQMTYHDPQQLQQPQQQAYQEQQQYPQQHVFQQQSGPPSSGANQQPLPVGGFNGAPVYVVMQSPGGAVTPGALPNGPFIPELLRNLPYGSNQRGVTIYELPEGARQHHTRGAESVPMSAAPSEGTRWSAPPEPPKYTSIPSSSSSSVSSGSQDDRNGAGRARWGDRGVGVGHLWAPGDETSPGGRPPDPLPPAWAETRDENVLPGAPLSKHGQRTYARGGGMLRMDPEELAEKERRKRQAEETQRIIKQQLEDKKRQKAVEEERERKEAALWEERVKEQQEREAREYMEEMRKKREKEENEERRQRQLQSAIKEAEDRAKREKELSKYGHLRSNAPMQKGNLLPDVGEEGEDDEESPPQASPSKQQHQTPQRRPSFVRNQQQLQRGLSEQSEHQESEEQQPLQPQLQQRPATAHRQGVQKSADVDGDERARLLRSLGLTPEMLLASSGLLDRTTLLTLLSATAAGQRQPSLLQPDLLQAEYITDRIITPTKYRGPPSRECGIQCDTPVSDRSSPRRETKRKGSRRNKSPSTSLPRDSGHSSDARPAWGHNHSDRPYRKQSEKDPYSGRRLRRRITRSLSRCDRDTATEESDLPQPQRRRRKTWDKSRQESLSSDLSRSPSPRDRVRLNKSSPASGRKWPPIKGSITPSLPRPQTPEIAKAPPTPSSQSIAEKEEEPGEEEEERDDNDDVVTSPVISALPESRSSSPPVPALMKKLTGASFFDIPEYPPGAEPPGSQSNLVPSTGKGNPKAQRKKSTSVTPVLPEIPTSRPQSKPPSPRSSPSEGGSLSERPSSTSLQPPAGGLKVEGLNGSDSSGAGSPHSRPPTPRRLPPMTPTKSDGSPRSPLATPVFRSSSPPVPAVAKRLSAQLRSAKSAEEPSVGEKQLTPVETPGSPRVASSPGASPASATTSGGKRGRHRLVHVKQTSEGVSSRPGSATSGHEEDVRTVSVTSSGYESGRRSSGEPRSLSEPLVSPDKWVILKSLSSLRQNLWRRHQELSQQPDSDGSC
ncbi:capping protein inhibiting regulator of actin dynamics-like isoform X4 [Macrobrachium rosenbergii]|uniref:capping protein inhibiting regulator of actin dynamics-like isoform X4 n=1 Tax=Macrobrachium rosenbergii TaxID=79674 RepID=UPI0034D5E59C